MVGSPQEVGRVGGVVAYGGVRTPGSGLRGPVSGVPPPKAQAPAVQAPCLLSREGTRPPVLVVPRNPLLAALGSVRATPTTGLSYGGGTTCPPCRLSFTLHPSPFTLDPRALPSYPTAPTGTPTTGHHEGGTSPYRFRFP